IAVLDRKMVLSSQSTTKIIAIVGFFTISLICAAIYFGLQRLQVGTFFAVIAHYSQMPIDDKPLENWLKERPGVVDRTVHIERKGTELRASFIMSQTLSGSPPVPDFSHACERLGYSPFATWQEEKPSN